MFTKNKNKKAFTPLNSAMPTAQRRYLTGFTLIELLVVCAIIGVLATIIIVNLTSAKENSKVSAAVAQLNTVRKAAELYRFDTHKWPVGPGTPGVAGSLDCRGGGTAPIVCTITNDPFLVDNGVTGWNGPYFENGIITLTHPWGGGVNYFNNDSGVCGGKQGIVLDEDRPGHDSSDNQGGIPFSALQKIDKILDDNVLTSGSIKQTVLPAVGSTPAQPIGELIYCFSS